jgi:predicted NUDIX family NTP pyrophosphohydrolase
LSRFYYQVWQFPPLADKIAYGENLHSGHRDMFRISAGLLMYRIHKQHVQVLLAHPGGPFFTNKDDGAWTIPKGIVEQGEDLLECARREFAEEIGVTPTGPFLPLAPVRQSGGKIVHAWAIEGDLHPRNVVSNCFTMEWPPKSGRQTDFPEIDRIEFFDIDVARRKINAGQIGLLDQLEEIKPSKARKGN